VLERYEGFFFSNFSAPGVAKPQRNGREGLISYFPSIRHGPHKKTTPTIFRCSGNVFTEPLPSNDRGYTYRHTRTDGRDL
jgi:hypothetical protein